MQGLISLSILQLCPQLWPAVNTDEGMSHHKLTVILHQNSFPSPRCVAEGLSNVTKINFFP